MRAVVSAALSSFDVATVHVASLRDVCGPCHQHEQSDASKEIPCPRCSWIRDSGDGIVQGSSFTSVHSHLSKPCLHPKGVGVFDGLGGACEATLVSCSWLEGFPVLDVVLVPRLHKTAVEMPGVNNPTCPGKLRTLADALREGVARLHSENLRVEPRNNKP